MARRRRDPMAAQHAATSCPEQRGSDPQGPPQRREALGRGPPRNGGSLPLCSGPSLCPPDGPIRRPTGAATGRANCWNALPVQGVARAAVVERARGRRGRQASPTGAIVLRSCRPLIRPLHTVTFRNGYGFRPLSAPTDQTNAQRQLLLPADLVVAAHATITCGSKTLISASCKIQPLGVK